MFSKHHSTNNPVTHQPRPHQDLILAHRLISSYYPETIIDNALPTELEKTVFRHLDTLRSVVPNLAQLRGKAILDIASGSRISPDNASHRWDPWMSRILHLLGAFPHAVDIYSQCNEPFASTQVDLTDPTALSIFKNSSFDGYYIYGFPNTTALASILHKGLSWKTVRDAIQIELNRILTPAGIVIRGFTEDNEHFIARSLSNRALTRLEWPAEPG